MKKCVLLTTLFIYLINVLTAQTLVNLQGTVTDNSNHAITSAVIHLLNTNLQTVTDADGRFAFTNISPGSYTIEASAIGYATATVVSAAANAVKITLQPDVNQLDE